MGLELHALFVLRQNNGPLTKNEKDKIMSLVLKAPPSTSDLNFGPHLHMQMDLLKCLAG